MSDAKTAWKNAEHFYSWGLPGGDFATRSGARMYRK